MTVVVCCVYAFVSIARLSLLSCSCLICWPSSDLSRPPCQWLPSHPLSHRLVGLSYVFCRSSHLSAFVLVRLCIICSHVLVLAWLLFSARLSLTACFLALLLAASLSMLVCHCSFWSVFWSVVSMRLLFSSIHLSSLGLCTFVQLLPLDLFYATSSPSAMNRPPLHVISNTHACTQYILSTSTNTTDTYPTARAAIMPHS